MARKRVLICGGTGFLGAAMARELVAMGGHDVTVTGHVRPVPADLEGVVARRFADLTMPTHCADACRGMDAVLMLAAVTSGARDIVERPTMHLTDNVVMNANVLRASWEAGVRDFLFVSSGAAYPDLGTDLALEEDDFWREGSFHPAYRWVGTMKRQAEELCHLYATLGMRMTVVRPSNVYGPGDNFSENGHVTAAMVRKFAEATRPGGTGVVEVWGDGNDARDLLHVDDFARGLVRAWSWTLGCQAVNVASGATVTVNEVVRCLEQVTGRQVETRHVEGPRTVPSRSFDVGKLRGMGWRPEVMLGDGLPRTLRWYEEHSCQ